MKWILNSDNANYYSSGWKIRAELRFAPPEVHATMDIVMKSIVTAAVIIGLILN